MGFEFLQTGPLVDAELELIQPQERWVDALMATCAHPQSASDPAATGARRSRVVDFLRNCPGGHQAADLMTGRVPSYHFWMLLHPSSTKAPPVEIAGGLSLRIGHTYDVEMYIGHIGYNVYPPARGHHYAARSCRLVLDLARAHGMQRLWITCNPDNWPSRRTCEVLGCQLAEIIPVPPAHSLYKKGDREKCRYWIDL